jgi:hypothetical protein
MKLVTVLAEPDEFFDGDSTDEGLAGPALVIGLLIGVSLATAFVYLRWLTSELPADVGTNVLLVSGISTGISALFVPLVLWVIYAVAFHVGSSFFDGSGQFSRTFRYVGWGFAPKIIGSGLVLVGTWLAVSSTPPPESTEAIQRATEAFESHPDLSTMRLLNPIFTVWSGVVWTFALARARDIPLQQAAITVGVPVAVSVGLTVAMTL